MPRLERHDTTPIVTLGKPLSVCRLAIVTTAGLRRRGDRPFGPGDQTYRVIGPDTSATDRMRKTRRLLKS